MWCALALTHGHASQFESFACDLSSLACPPGMRDSHTHGVRTERCQNGARLRHVAPGHWFYACHFGAFGKRRDALSYRNVTCSIGCVRIFNGHGFRNSGRIRALRWWFPWGGRALVTKENTGAIRMITYLSRLSNHNQPQTAHAVFLEPYNVSNIYNDYRPHFTGRYGTYIISILKNKIQLILTDFQFSIFSISETVSPCRTMWNLFFAFLAFFIALV